MQTLSAPSKTFLVGEYGVLIGGPALILNTEPRFQLKVELVENKSKSLKDEHHFYAHKDSPAGKLWSHFSEAVIKKTGQLHFDFIDPWQEAGGMGRSGAEFLLLREWLKQNGFVTKKTLMKDYKEFATAGSGADVLSQSTGQVAVIESVLSEEAKALKWPNWDLSFLIYKTGRKMKTHEHLEKTDKKSGSPKAYKKLAEIATGSVEAFRKKSLHAFLNSLTDFSAYQKKHDLIDVENYYLLEKMMNLPSVCFARGCGALGFDTFLVFYQKEFKKTVRQDIEKDFPFLKLVADTSQLTKGIQ